MAASQQFCVKWNSYSTNLQSVFPRLLTSEHFVDVTLACEGEMIKCHKVVLSACSTYFERLLVSNPCPHPIIFMKDMKHFEVQALVDFMYRGEVNVSQDELNSLLIAAEALQIRGLCGSENMATAAVNGRPRTGSQHMPPSPRSAPPQNTEPDPPNLSQPTKRRRSDSDAKPKIVSVTSNGEEVGVGTVSFRHNAAAEAQKQLNIKQESLDMEDNYGNDLDADVLDEDLDRLEPQEDSDGLQQESRTSQAGPSGLSQPASRSGTTTPDKTATDYADPLSFQETYAISDKEVPYPFEETYDYTATPRYYPPPPVNNDSVLRRLLQSTSSYTDLSISTPLETSKPDLRPAQASTTVTPIPFVQIKCEPDASETSSESDSGSECIYEKAVADPHQTNPNPYSTPQLRRALNQVKSGVSIYSAARSNGVPTKSLRNWMARLKIKSKYELPRQLKTFFHRQKLEKKMSKKDK